jgi:hypothetical protein
MLSACAGSGPPPSDANSAFDQLQRNIFDQHCLSAGCHNSQSLAGGLNLSSGASYAALVGVTPTNVVADANGLLRVEPFNPDNSFLLVKVTAPAPGEGSRMPLAMDPLSPSDIQSIRNWILSGAPPGGTAGPTESPTPTASATPSASVTGTATPTPIPVDTSTPTATVTGTAPATATATASPTPTPTATPTATLSQFAEIQQTIFNVTCTQAFCHDQRGMSGGLVLVEGQSYANLVGVQPDNDAARADGLLRVDPGNPNNSFLFIKVEGPTNVLYGSQMPLAQDPLPPEQMQLIQSWIANGAQP